MTIKINEVTETDIVCILGRVIPYLVGKKAQALLLMNMLQAHKKGARYQDHETVLVEKLKALKRAGFGDTEPSRGPLGSRACVENMDAASPSGDDDMFRSQAKV